LIIRIAEEDNIWRSSLCGFLQLLTTASHFSPNILNALILCCSLNVRDQVLQPYKTTALYILIFTFVDSR
jgi:hypothetical protein